MIIVNIIFMNKIKSINSVQCLQRQFDPIYSYVMIGIPMENPDQANALPLGLVDTWVESSALLPPPGQ